MLDLIQEEKFIRAFIKKPFQDRFLYEIKKADRRENIEKKIAHGTDYFKPEYIYLNTSKLQFDEIGSIMVKLSEYKGNSYLFTKEESACGYYSLKDGLDWYFENMIPCILICGPKAAFVGQELCIGSPNKIILYQRGRSVN